MDINKLRAGHRLDQLSTDEITRRLKDEPSLFVPVGSTEQHGAHLPLCTDALCAEMGALLTAEQVPALVAPPVCFGVSPQHARFAGTISIPPVLLIELLAHVAGSLIPHGFKHLFFFNGHGGNASALEIAARQIYTDHGIPTAVVSVLAAILRTRRLPVDAGLAQMIARQLTGHGSYIETSLIMAIDPDLVDMSKADLRPIDNAFLIEDSIVSGPYMIEEKSETGVFGDVSGASPAAGQEMWCLGVDKVVRHIDKYLKRSASNCAASDRYGASSNRPGSHRHP